MHLVLLLAAVFGLWGGFFAYFFSLFFALSSVIVNLFETVSTGKCFKSFMFQIIFDSVQVLSVREGTPREFGQGRGIDLNFFISKGIISFNYCKISIEPCTVQLEPDENDMHMR